MNNTIAETKQLIADLKPLVKDAKCDVVICTPYTDLATAVAETKGSNIKVGAENVHWAEKGAFTGEISAKMLVELGVEYVIIGHSERRQYFGETDQTVNARVKAALAAGLKVILCIGETLEEREGGKVEEVLVRQTTEAFKDIDKSELENIVIAYEPVWAIGTGKTATSQDANDTIKIVRDTMAKLYFKYGAMGSSKTAQALITKYNYEENDLNVWLIKPGTDTRDGAKILRSRIGLESPADVIAPGTDIYLLFQDTQEGKCDVIIVDECQFLTESQIDQLRALVNDYNIPVMCFGLRTDFQTRLFPGSRRLMEVADTIQEIKTICDCGAKATVNARIDGDGHIITQGAQVVLGGNDSYIAMCHKCYIRGIREHRVIRLHGHN